MPGNSSGVHCQNRRCASSVSGYRVSQTSTLHDWRLCAPTACGIRLSCAAILRRKSCENQRQKSVGGSSHSTPYDRRRMPASGQIRLPANVLFVAPRRRGIATRHAVVCGAAPLPPLRFCVVLLRPGCNGAKRQRRNQPHSFFHCVRYSCQMGLKVNI